MIIAMVRVVTCHGLAMVHAQDRVARVRGVQAQALNHAREHLGRFSTEWWDLEIKWTLDSILACSCPQRVWLNGRMNSFVEFGQTKNWEVCH